MRTTGRAKFHRIRCTAVMAGCETCRGSDRLQAATALVITVYPITGLGKPRMTRQDQWLVGKRKRPPVARYHAFQDECRLVYRVALDVSKFYHVVFVMPMPASWSAKKRAEQLFAPHRQKPDKDNLEKALLDALFEDDAIAWDGRVSKVWGERGVILIADKPVDVSRESLRALFAEAKGL